MGAGPALGWPAHRLPRLPHTQEQPVASIEAVGAREILDSRGNPTVEVEVLLDDGPFARAAVPSGASTGAFEAVELRDGGDRYLGKGVQKAVDAVHPDDRPGDRGPRRRRPAADRPDDARARRHAQQGQRSAPTRSSASRSPSPAPPPTRAGLPLYRYVGGPNAHLLPVPMMNILNGGAHADSNVDVQEFMIAPIGAPTFTRGAALGRRGLPRAQVGAEEEGPVHRPGRRGRLRAQPRLQPRPRST